MRLAPRPCTRCPQFSHQLPVFDGGDRLHPNDEGMQAMADAVDLKALDCTVRTPSARTGPTR